MRVKESEYVGDRRVAVSSSEYDRVKVELIVLLRDMEVVKECFAVPVLVRLRVSRWVGLRLPVAVTSIEGVSVELPVGVCFFVGLLVTSLDGLKV